VINGAGALMMRSHVDVAGSGQNTTRLFAVGAGALGGYPATVATASNAELSDLTVESTGGGGYAFAVTGSGSTRAAQLRNVTAIASGGSSVNQSITNQNTASQMPRLSNVRAVASGANAVAIYNSCSAADIDGATISVFGSGSNVSGIRDSNNPSNCGINVRGRINNVRGTVQGGNTNFGISAGQSYSLFSNIDLTVGDSTSLSVGLELGSLADASLRSSSIRASSSAQSIGLRAAFSGQIRVEGSALIGDTAAIDADGSAVLLIANSRLEGGTFVSGSATVTCAGIYDEFFSFYGSLCP